MGNVSASSSQMPMPPPPTDPSPVKNPEPAAAAPTSGGLEYPGTMEDMHKKCKDVFPSVFEGAKLMVNKPLSNHFQVSHTVNMSSVNSSGYRFGATYVGTNQTGPGEAFPVLLGDIDPSGNLNANWIHAFGTRVKTKFSAQVVNGRFPAAQMSTDYRGDDFSCSLIVANPDIINGSGVAVSHFLQQVSSRVALGAELAYQVGPAVPGGQIAVLTAAARWTGDNSVVSATLGNGGAHVCFYQKASEQLSFGVEMETSFRAQESVASLGYAVEIPKADLTFRGMVDTNGTVGAVMEKKLPPLPFSFALSGTMNHAKAQFRLGCGLIIG